MKIQIMLQVYQGYKAPEAPDKYSREKRGVVWQYTGESLDWDTARSLARQLSQQEGVSSVEIYNVTRWTSTLDNTTIVQ